MTINMTIKRWGSLLTIGILSIGLGIGIGLSVMTTSLYAASRYNLEDFEKNKLSGSAGLTTINGQKYLTTGLSPNLKFKGVEVGLGLDLNIPLESYDSKPSDLQAITLRHIGYNYNDKWGFRWGRLSNITFGYGLLMDNYDSGSFGSSRFSNKKAGVLGFATFKDLRTDVMYTVSKVQAARVSYQYPLLPVIKTPIIFGATIINDNNGIDPSDRGITRPSQMGYGVDVGIPIAGELLTLYSEFAQLDKSGTDYDTTEKQSGRGASIGAKGSLFTMVNYVAEYRYFQSSFIPGYFNSTYESTSFDAKSDNPFNETQSGFIVGAYSHLLNGYIKAGATYEYYKDKQLAIASLGWKKIANTIGVVNYTVPIQGRRNAIVEADILYMPGGLLSYIINFKRAYTTVDKYEDSYSMGIRMDLDSFLPDF